MKKIIKVAVAFLLAATVISPFKNVQAASNDVVNIPDKNLLEGLKNITQRPFADELTEADLAKIDFADISYLDKNSIPPGPISDLTGLEHAVNMTKIHFSYDKMRDLNVLAGLPNLKTIIGVGTELRDIAALGTLPKLESVEIGGNYVTDFTPLLKAPNLKKFSYNSYAWTNPNYHQINNEEFKFFVDLPTLETLDLTDNKITNLSPLNQMDNIIGLYLDYNQLEDISPIATMKKLKILYLNNNQLMSIDALNTLRGLRVAYADNNHITDLSNLKDFYESMEPVGDYKGFQVNNQTITLPTINIKEGETAVSKNPTLDINGQKCLSPLFLMAVVSQQTIKPLTLKACL